MVSSRVQLIWDTKIDGTQMDLAPVKIKKMFIRVTKVDVPQIDSAGLVTKQMDQLFERCLCPRSLSSSCQKPESDGGAVGKASSSQISIPYMWRTRIWWSSCSKASLSQISISSIHTRIGWSSVLKGGFIPDLHGLNLKNQNPMEQLFERRLRPRSQSPLCQERESDGASAWKIFSSKIPIASILSGTRFGWCICSKGVLVQDPDCPLVKKQNRMD